MYEAKVFVVINASPKKVWEALTNPKLIKQYLFGMDTITDWKSGSKIRWRGVWEGKSYEDKGEVIEAVPEKMLRYTYWSSMSGLEDKKENYVTVSCIITDQKNNVKLTITQDNIKTKESKEHSEKSWSTVGGCHKDSRENISTKKVS